MVCHYTSQLSSQYVVHHIQASTDNIVVTLQDKS